MNQAVIALGSNIGDSLKNMQIAIDYLEEYGCLIMKKSKVYQTEPWGYKDQADFLNAAVLVETTATPRGLLEITQGIEKKMERNKEFLNGPRNIDLDILVYDDKEITEDDLTVPHSRLHQRLFVLKPMADVAPTWQVPGLGTVSQLLEAHPKDERVDLTDLAL